MVRMNARALYLCIAAVVSSLLLSSSAGATHSGGSHAYTAESLRAEVDTLRVQARYIEAARVARTLRSRLQADPSHKSHEITDATLLVRTLESIAALTPVERVEMAQADRANRDRERAYARGDYSVADSLARQVLETRRRLLGGEHIEVAASLNDCGLARWAQGDYAGAESLYQQALAIRRKLLGEKHPDVATTTSNLADVLRARGDYSGAESLYRDALAMRRELLGPEHRDVARSLNNLAILLRARGDYAGAEPLYREALAMERKLLGEEHRYVAASLNNLGILLQARGDYASAEPLYREALAMGRRLLGAEHPYVASFLNNLAGLLRVRRDYDGAEPLYREALAIERKLHGEGHPLVARALNNLASLLHARGDLDSAEPLYREALEMQRRFLGEGHPDIALTLSNLAGLLEDRREFADAERLFREALEMQRQLQGEEHPDVAAAVANLAGVMHARGDDDDAERLYREALAMRRQLLGNEHPDVVTTYCDLADLLHARGDDVEAERLLSEAGSAFEAARLRAGPGMERATFLSRSPYPMLAAVRLDLDQTESAWAAAERSQGRALADLLLASGGRPLSADEAHEEDSLRLVVGDLEQRLTIFRGAARIDSSGVAHRETETARTQLLEAESRWASFERSIAQKYPLTEGGAFDLARIQAALRSEEAIIGWLDVPREDGVQEFPAWAYVIRARGPVQWRRLPHRARPPLLESLLDDVRRWLNVRPDANRASDLSRAGIFLRRISRRPLSAGLPLDAARQLGHERVAPVLDFLGGISHLIVIPSGEMVGIPVEALIIDGRTELAGERFAISYIPSATIYAWLRQREDEAETRRTAVERPAWRCLAIGDPPFCPDHLAAPDSVTAAGFRGDKDLLIEGAPASSRTALQSLRRLPTTRAEASLVASMYGEGSRLLLSADATEQELVRMSFAGELKRFQVLHFATHALVDDEQPENSALILSQLNLPDPLQAALAGTRIMDGCVSAAEIVREWDLDADLVTLSACQTALGKEVPGEGQIGLAHAFLRAGARSLLVSLWEVEDRSTSMLMQRFHANLSGGGLPRNTSAGGARSISKVEALQEAKRWLREWRDDRGNQPYAHPFFWAGFILVGSPQ